MRYEISNYDYLMARLAECVDDDATLPWSNYPCLLWERGRHTRGYGVMRLPVSMGGEHKRPHVFAYEQAHGQATAGQEICHFCDSPPCIRPIHLFAGTHTENMMDMIQKGRRVLPGKRYKLLSRESVMEIRHLYEAGTTQKCLAHRFDRTEKAISSIVNGRSYSPDGAWRFHGNIMRGENAGRSIVTESDVLEMRRMYSLGMRISSIAKLFPQIKYVSVEAIIARRNWTHI